MSSVITRKLGTRGSELALVQARYVQGLLKAQGLAIELEIIRTQGDKEHVLSFTKMEGKGFFTKELEEALQSGQIDLAVHSFKDLPTEFPKGLRIAAIPTREDPRDCLLIRQEFYDAAAGILPVRAHARVGTSAVRRKAQLQALCEDLQTMDLRGNVPTRVQKLRDGDYDAIVVACAGLARLKLDVSDFVSHVLEPQDFVPAPAQGALAIQIRDNDTELFTALQSLHNSEAAHCVQAERELLARFDGGCHLPLGAHALFDGQQFVLYAFLGNDDGSYQRFVETDLHLHTLVANAYEALCEA
jgi:hydroxymethylbilane synthase